MTFCCYQFINFVFASHFVAAMANKRHTQELIRGRFIKVNELHNVAAHVMTINLFREYVCLYDNFMAFTSSPIVCANVFLQ